MQQANETPEEHLRRDLSTAQKENDRVSPRFCPSPKAPLTFLRSLITINASLVVAARASPLTANSSYAKTAGGAISELGTRI
jgi:hypothetical protein